MKPLPQCRWPVAQAGAWPSRGDAASWRHHRVHSRTRPPLTCRSQPHHRDRTVRAARFPGRTGSASAQVSRPIGALARHLPLSVRRARQRPSPCLPRSPSSSSWKDPRRFPFAMLSSDRCWPARAADAAAIADHTIDADPRRKIHARDSRQIRAKPPKLDRRWLALRRISVEAWSHAFGAVRWALRCLFISNMVTDFLPKILASLSSPLICRRSLAS